MNIEFQYAKREKCSLDILIQTVKWTVKKQAKNHKKRTLMTTIELSNSCLQKTLKNSKRLKK